jgi:hypothetical protein
MDNNDTVSQMVFFAVVVIILCGVVTRTIAREDPTTTIAREDNTQKA